jgi:hypothetical protein
LHDIDGESEKGVVPYAMCCLAFSFFDDGESVKEEKRAWFNFD